MPLNRSDTLNFVRNDPDTLQYRPFVPSHAPPPPSNDAKVPSALSKSISFGGNANTNASNMYDDDIDFMNNYLKSLPDYNELNKKISNEQKKCADIYDQLKSINTSLQSQTSRLPKSNSFHSICTGASTKPFAMQPISVAHFANDIQAKNKNSTVINRNAMASTAASSSIEGVGVAIGADKSGPKPAIGSSTSSSTTTTKTSSTAVTAKPTAELNNVMRPHHPLPKSASSSCVNMNMNMNLMANDANGPKKCLNDFWSEHLARNNQQKFGWNYNKIMAVQKANKQPPIENVPVAAAAAAATSTGNTNSYKLQKNMSLSQLDNRIRQDLSREELYNLICNSDQSTVNRANVPQPQRQPLSKSMSQTSVPSASFAIPVKISRKPSIPTLFKPLCKSTSNTHVFNRNYDTSDEPRETFTPKLLVKSCSSSSVFGQVPPSSATSLHSSQTSNNHQNNNNHFHPIHTNSTQSRILRNNELLKGGQTPAQAHQTKLFNGNATVTAPKTANDYSHQPSTKQMAANDFFMKQNVPQPNKVIVNYPPFKSASSVQIPLHGNLPPAFGQPMPPTTSTATMLGENKNCAPSANERTATNFYNSNATTPFYNSMVQPKQMPMYSTSSTTTMTATTSVGSKNNSTAAAAAATAPPLKCKNEVNQQNELLKQPSSTAATTTTTAMPSNVYPNKTNFNEIDSNRNAKVRPYGVDTSTFKTPSSSSLSMSSSFRNGCAGNSTIAAVHCPSNGEQQQFATLKPDPMEKIPRRMPVQPTAVTGAPPIGMPAAKKLPHSFSSSCVNDLLRANAAAATAVPTTIPNHSNVVRPANIPGTQNQNNFTAQTMLYSRLYPNVNFSSSKPLHNSIVTKPNVAESQPQHHQPRNNVQMQTPMPYKPFQTQPYALTQSKSATAISRKDSSWLERHGYEIVNMSTSMHNAEVVEVAEVVVCMRVCVCACL